MGMPTIVCPCCAHEFPNNTLEEHFWASVRKTNTCWEWVGNIKKNGYGRIGSGLKDGEYLVHRYSYELHYGSIPEGMLVCHKCDNRKCVRPDHLFLGTHADNMADMIAKGRGRYPGASGEANHKHRFTQEQVLSIRSEYIPRKMGITALAKKYGVSYNAIDNIVKGKMWKHLPPDNTIPDIKTSTHHTFDQLSFPLDLL
jgi:hypothetical protein